MHLFAKAEGVLAGPQFDEGGWDVRLMCWPRRSQTKVVWFLLDEECYGAGALFAAAMTFPPNVCLLEPQLRFRVHWT